MSHQFENYQQFEAAFVAALNTPEREDHFRVGSRRLMLSYLLLEIISDPSEKAISLDNLTSEVRIQELIETLYERIAAYRDSSDPDWWVNTAKRKKLNEEFEGGRLANINKLKEVLIVNGLPFLEQYAQERIPTRAERKLLAEQQPLIDQINKIVERFKKFDWRFVSTELGRIEIDKIIIDSYNTLSQMLGLKETLQIGYITLERIYSNDMSISIKITVKSEKEIYSIYFPQDPRFDDDTKPKDRRLTVILPLKENAGLIEINPLSDSRLEEMPYVLELATVTIKLFYSQLKEQLLLHPIALDDTERMLKDVQIV